METTTANWGEVIQKEYVRFLRYCHDTDWSGWKMYSAGMFDQLVKDGFIATDAHLALMKDSKSSFVGELQKKIALRQMGSRIEPSGNQKERDLEEMRIANVKSEIVRLEKEVAKYNEGHYDDRIELRAKQWTILTLFRDGKKNKVLKIYEPEEE